MWWWHGDWGWGAWLAMTAGMLVFWGLVIWGVVTLVRSGTASREPAARPEEILAARFASGEIDEDEYEHRLATLRAARGRAAEKAGSRP